MLFGNESHENMSLHVSLRDMNGTKVVNLLDIYWRRVTHRQAHTLKYGCWAIPLNKR